MTLLVGLVCCALFLPFLVDAVSRSRAEPKDVQVLAIWIGLGTLMFAAALLSRDLERSTSLHWFGAAFLTLTLGYGRALLTSSIIVFASTPLAALGPGLLVDALIPVWLTCLLVAASRRWLPPNPFVFLLGCGFFGLFAVNAVQLVLGLGVDALPGMLDTPGSQLVPPVSERLIWGLLLAAGEATLEGMIITVLVVYLPQAVELFDDAYYLGEQTDE